MAKRKRPKNGNGEDSKKAKTRPLPSQEAPVQIDEVWSKSKKKRMRKLLAKQSQNNKNNETGGPRTKKQRKEAGGTRDGRPHREEGSEGKAQSTKRNHLKIGGKKSALQESFLARLSGARFRDLNEQLYTTTSKSAFETFSSKPELYEQYHEGFRHQVEGWPVNPVTVIARSLASQFKDRDGPPCVVADFGCGDAELAKKLLAVKRPHKGGGGGNSCPFTVHSFDLVASCPLVTPCDMASVPIPDTSVDVAVFCLSLMGTNLADFIREAHRVLKSNGIMKIAEVRSRFESTASKDEIQEFIKVLEKLGFDCVKNDRSNKMFVVLEMRKAPRKPDAKLKFTAKPCIYKRR